MEEQMSKDQILFSNLVIMFQTAAMQHMGKLKNPISGKIERDIEQAKISIDILEMIQKKTKGNLEEYESKLISSILHELRLNYVYERDKKDAGEESQKENKKEEMKESSAGGGDADKKTETNPARPADQKEKS